jgi:hypothetical protein
MINLSAFFKKFEFLIKIAVFALTFYYTLDYIFVCEVSNLTGVSILIGVLITITLLHYFFGKKEQNVCPLCKK